MLQMNNPPLTTTEFEDNIRRAVLVDKLRDAVTGWMSVSDQDVADEFRRRNEKVKLDVVPITPDAFKTPGHGQRRRHRALLRQAQGDLPHRREAEDPVRARSTSRRCASTVKVPEADIEAFYKQNLHAVPDAEQVRASHILLKTRRQGRSGRCKARPTTC